MSDQGPLLLSKAVLGKTAERLGEVRVGFHKCIGTILNCTKLSPASLLPARDRGLHSGE